MNQDRLEGLLKVHQTPFYVFDEDKVRETAAHYQEILGDRADLCYAMKANPFLTEAFARLADRIEVCSYGEFKICQVLGIPQEKLLISGVLKRETDMEEILAVLEDRACYTAESPAQYGILEEWSRVNKKPLKVYLRLSSKNQFGMDSEAIRELIRRNQKKQILDLRGIHYFSGTQKKSLDRIQKELTKLVEFADILKQELDFETEELEYGAGLPISYFEGQEDSASENLELLSEFLASLPFDGRVIIELGRALAAASGVYVTAICDLKRTEGKGFAIVDGGMHQLNYDGQIRGMYVPAHRLIPRRTEGETEDWTVCGSLCTTNDVLIQKLSACDLQVGDALVFENTGAYAALEGMALFLSHELPEIILSSEAEGDRTLRTRRETYPWNMKEEQ